MSSVERATPPTREKIERELTGEPLVLGERRVQTVAQLAGWKVSPGGEMGTAAGGQRRLGQFQLQGTGGQVQQVPVTGQGGGAWVEVRPVEVRVREGDGREYTVPIVDKTAEQIRQMVMAAFIFGTVCWFVAWLLNRQAAKKGRRRKR